MFLSLLPALTVLAFALSAIALVAALPLAKGRHASFFPSREHRGGLAIGAALVALPGVVGGLFLGFGPVGAALAAALLALPVFGWALLAPWWPVRAVVAWAMLVVGSVGLVALAGSRALESAVPLSAVPVAAAASATAVFLLGRLNGPFRRVLGIRAGIRRATPTPILLRPGLRRPALALAVFFAAMGVGGLTGVAPGPGEAAQAAGTGAGPGSSDGSDARPVSAQTTPTPPTSGPFAAGGSGLFPGLTGSGQPWSSEPGMQGAVGSGSSMTSTAGIPTSTSGNDRSTDGSSDGSADPVTGPTPSPLPSSPIGEPTPTPSLPSDPTSKPVETVTETVKTVTKAVQEQVESTTEPVTSTVEKTTEPVKSTVESTTEPVKSTVETVTEPVTSTVEETVKPVQETLDSTTDQVTSSGGSLLP